MINLLYNLEEPPFLPLGARLQNIISLESPLNDFSHLSKFYHKYKYFQYPSADDMVYPVKNFHTTKLYL